MVIAVGEEEVVEEKVVDEKIVREVNKGVKCK
jgi:hypothetical protein